MNMQYRKLPHGMEQISVIGMGMGSIHQDNSEEEIEQVVCLAMENGINYFDMAAPDEKPYISYARAFEGRREQVYLQMHFGAVYDNGKYGWTRDVKRIKDAFAEQLDILHTNYTDMGYVHCVDEMDDFQKVMSDGVWDYMKCLKRDGVIRHLGVSSHTPEIVRRFLDTGLIDMIMFSINPAYDYSIGKYGISTASDRGLLYRECEKAGVGIAVMKLFGGGQLLDSKTSPFRKALTENQCIQYALDRPGVLTVLPGFRNKADLEKVLAYFKAEQQETDYSAIGQFELPDADGICVYCNHCQPCPKGLDVGLINKYYDLALAGDEMAKSHYDKLTVKADKCVQCGHCESRCPFHVKQETRMKEIAHYFQE